MGNKVYRVSSIPTSSSTIEREKPAYKDLSMISVRETKNGVLNSGKNLKINMETDVEAVKIAMKNLFTFIQGERVLNPEFGNAILKYIYSGINEFNVEQMIGTIRQMVSKYEPRAVIDSVSDVSAKNDTENNTVQLKIVWHVIGLDETKYTLLVGEPN